MASLDQISAVTHRVILPVVVDNIFQSNPTFALLYKNRVHLDGGRLISQPIYVTKGGSPTSYSGADTLPSAFDEETTSLDFNWAQYAARIQITGLDEARNSGDAAIVNLLKIKMQGAEANLRQTLGSDLQGDGTGNGGKALVGLAAMVDDATNVATYGNVSRNTFTSMKAVYSANAGVGRALTMSLLNTNFQAASKDNDRPTVNVTTPNLFTKYMSLLQPTVRTGDGNTANMGFPNSLYFGRPVIFDDQVQTTPVHKWWMLNMRHMTLYAHRNRDFMFVPFQTEADMDVATAKILFMVQPICDSSRLQCQITDLDPSL